MMPLAYFTGSHRLLNFKNFSFEVGTGLVLDFFCFALPTLFIQAINNATLYQMQYQMSGLLIELNGLQSVAMISKLLLLGDIVIETIMFAYEMIKRHQLEKQGLSKIGHLSEYKRRKEFAKRYTCRSMLWLVTILVCFILTQFFVDPAACQPTEAVKWGRICESCQVENCVGCRQTGKHGCDLCKDGFFYDALPGRCEDASCRVKHCDDCSRSGILKCDVCAEGFYWN